MIHRDASPRLQPARRAPRTALVALVASSFTPLAAAPAAGAGPSAPNVTITVLPTIEGAAGMSGVASDINDRGEIIGTFSSSSPVVHRPAFWHDGTVTELDGFGPTVAALQLNDRGQVLLHGTRTGGETDYFIWDAGTLTEAVPGPDAASGNVQLNNRGQMLLWRVPPSRPPGPIMAGLWDAGRFTPIGEIVDFTTVGTILQPFRWYFLNGVLSDSGDVTASMGPCVRISTNPLLPPPVSVYCYPFMLRWHQGQFVGLPGMGTPNAVNASNTAIGITATIGSAIWADGRQYVLGSSSGTDTYEAIAINDHGQVTGTVSSDRADGSTAHRAFRWENGRVVDLTTEGGPDVTPIDINERGQVLGSCGDGGRRYPCVWDADGTVVDLMASAPGLERARASAINDRGQIVGSAVSPEGQVPVLWELDRS